MYWSDPQGTDFWTRSTVQTINMEMGTTSTTIKTTSNTIASRTPATIKSTWIDIDYVFLPMHSALYKFFKNTTSESFAFGQRLYWAWSKKRTDELTQVDLYSVHIYLWLLFPFLEQLCDAGIEKHLQRKITEAVLPYYLNLKHTQYQDRHIMLPRCLNSKYTRCRYSIQRFNHLIQRQSWL